MLDPRIAAASVAAADLTLCHVRLQDDARWPWLVLVPRRVGAVELDALSPADRVLAVEEAARAASAIRALGAAFGRSVEKINLGALGNVVPQLHLHVVGRRADDTAWPGPVWGAGVAERYGPERLGRALEIVRAALV